MNPYEQTQLEFRIKAAISRELSFYSLPQTLREVKEIAPGLYFVESVFEGHLVCECLIFDNGGHTLAFFSAACIRSFVIDPMLKSYTADHPWIVGCGSWDVEITYTLCYTCCS